MAKQSKKPRMDSIMSSIGTLTCGQRLSHKFYKQSCLTLAKQLLGQVLVRKLDTGELIKGKIVETEGYLGVHDTASHSFKGQTARNMAMFMDPGTAYVYHIYGVYSCFNVSSEENGSAVLIRAVEPMDGIYLMQKHRQAKQKNVPKKEVKLKELCNGPSKLCQAFVIEKGSCDRKNLCDDEILWIEFNSFQSIRNIVTSKRVGIGGSGSEAASKPWRFYLHKNIHVSVKDKTAEEILETTNS